VIRHTVTALAAAGVLLAGACSSGDGNKAAAASDGSTKAATSEQFCSSAKALYDQLQTAGATDPSSPAVQSVFAEARDLNAPDEIASDWREVLDALEPLVDGEVDLNDPAGVATLTDRTAEAADSFQRTGQYFEQKCGFGSTTTAPGAAPTATPTTASATGSTDASVPAPDPSTAPTGAPTSTP
jgi:hypothetical protein